MSGVVAAEVAPRPNTELGTEEAAEVAQIPVHSQNDCGKAVVVGVGQAIVAQVPDDNRAGSSATDGKPAEASSEADVLRMHLKCRR
jgi:hypothetical protein